jgi:hypothetical protein
MVKTGATNKPEIQVIPCELVTKANADGYRSFERIGGDSQRLKEQ